MRDDFSYSVLVELNRFALDWRTMRIHHQDNFSDGYKDFLQKHCIEYRWRDGVLTEKNVLEPSYLRCALISFRSAENATFFKLTFADRIIEFPEDGHFINC